VSKPKQPTIIQGSPILGRKPKSSKRKRWLNHKVK
jgi:hypothetical protein